MDGDAEAEVATAIREEAATVVPPSREGRRPSSARGGSTVAPSFPGVRRELDKISSITGGAATVVPTSREGARRDLLPRAVAAEMAYGAKVEVRGGIAESVVAGRSGREEVTVSLPICFLGELQADVKPWPHLAPPICFLGQLLGVLAAPVMAKGQKRST